MKVSPWIPRAESIMFPFLGTAQHLPVPPPPSAGPGGDPARLCFHDPCLVPNVARFILLPSKQRRFQPAEHAALWRPASGHASSSFLRLLLGCDGLVFLCCVSVRSAAPDLRKLTEDGELRLVLQGLKGTTRVPRPLLQSVPAAEGRPAQAGAAFSSQHLSHVCGL